MSAPTSRLPGFRGLAPDERRDAAARAAQMPRRTIDTLGGPALDLPTADGMVENVIGRFELPLGLAANFRVNGREMLIPMAVEEPSVIAAASNMARLAHGHGGFTATTTDPLMRGQIQVLRCPDAEAAEAALIAATPEIVARANDCDPVLVGLGGGCRDIEVHRFDETAVGPMVVLHILVDVRDAMGANAVNTMAEALAPRVEALTGGKVRLRILSNLADRRLARAELCLPVAALDMPGAAGADVARGIVEAAALAEVDPYRAATHNKGIMNGIDPVVLATGNDWRAIEAGAHAYAARSGRYQSLTRWRLTEADQLHGTLEMPMAVGLVGGAVRTHPAARAAIEVLGVTTASELAGIIAAVGLAQNLGALRALATDGIQKGHMALHARNIAVQAGARGEAIDRVAAQLVRSGDISAHNAKALLTGDAHTE